MVLQTLLLALASLVVGFGVLMAGYVLAQGLGSAAAASALLATGIGALVLLVITSVLLLVVLGVNELGRRDE